MALEIGRVSFDDYTYEPVIRFEKYENGDKVVYTKSGKYRVRKVCGQYDFSKEVEYLESGEVVKRWVPCNNSIVKIETFCR